MRTHWLTSIAIISKRYKRLALFVLFVGFLFLFTSQAYDYDHQDLLSIFNNDDQDILKHIANSDVDVHEDSSSKIKDHIDVSANVKSQSFFTDFIDKLHSFREDIPTLKLIKSSEYERDQLLSKPKLLEFLAMENDTVAALNKVHQKVLDLIPKEFPSNLYQKDGIVFIGGGQYSWLSLLSIKSLRSFGCKLPIEMIIPTEEEYEHDLCEEILPALNGKCVLLHNVLGKETMSKVEFSGYQYKSLALIASSFDNVLLLDSDNIVISNPESFFKSEVFKKTGMVVWPDYWERTTSPYFYEIVGVAVNDSLRVRDGKWELPTPLPVEDLSKVRYHDLKGTIPDLSSESGQVLIRKSDHVKTILLSFFYNLYGPGFFYTLLGQGNSGEGDKDTFIAGALVGGESFYQVKSSIKTFGWFNAKQDKFEGVCMGQKNPIEDYEEFKKMMVAGGNPDSFKEDEVSIFTIHANYPKLNPYLLYTEKKLINEEGNEFRMYSDISNFLGDEIDDFEYIQFKRMEFLLCDMNVSLKYFNKISRDEICEFIGNHLKFLKENPVI